MLTLIKILSLLPLSVLYAIAQGLLYPLIYYVVGYRRKMVRHNLRLAFPDKPDNERQLIEKQFYHWFADLLAEIVHGYRATDEEMRERIQYGGLDELAKAARQHGGAMLMIGHIGCWEWYAEIAKQSATDLKFHYIYRRLKSESADKAMLELRKKRGGDCIEKNLLLRRMVSYRKDHLPHIYCMLSDQKPSAQDLDYRLPFLNTDSPFITGTDTLARKFGYPVFYIDYTMPSRGHYIGRLKLITDAPEITDVGGITREYTKLLEQTILRTPHIWLWTHNRFKYSKPL